MTCANNIVNNVINPQPDVNSSRWVPSIELGFIGALPSEIITTIFFYLNRADCLTCMAVCRDWYHLIPQYVRNVWIKVTLCSHDIQNMRLLRCLGDHIRTVTFYKLHAEEEVFQSLKKLLERRCTSIKNLRFIGCTANQDDVFLKLLSKLAPQLTHLKMVAHNSNVSFLHLFKACPMLTHFTYSPSEYVHRQYIVYDKVPIAETTLQTPTQFTRISYLCLDVILHRELRLKPILKACPNLRYFLGPAMKYHSSQSFEEYRASTVDLDSLFRWCPRIIHLQNNYSYEGTLELAEYNTSKGGDGLRYLSQCEDDGRDSISRLLARNSSTLEHLALRRYSHDATIPDWSPVFQSLDLPHLRTLDLYEDICYDAPSLVTLLNHCPVLESLRLVGDPLVLESSALQQLQTMDRLTSLQCLFLEVIDGLTLISLFDRLTMLEDITLSNSCIPLQQTLDTHHGPAHLKRLTLEDVDWKYDGDDIDGAIARFFKYLSGRSKLESVQVSSLNLGSKSIQAIAAIPTLKSFEIELLNNSLLPREEESYFGGLASMLKETVIQKLKLSNIHSLTYNTLNTLGDLPLLQEFHTTAGPALRNRSCTTVNISGLVQLLRNSSNLTKISLNNITIQWSNQVPSFDSLAQLIKLEMPFYQLQPMKGSGIRNVFPLFVIERYPK
ncbi:hypothetical protein BJV82DRAFT_636957 [Fennellomyces sp. T-0311]|nr:hypothetical protein BJV82DRAFT_636957 [Fennellomyces sp. T-0311]